MINKNLNLDEFSKGYAEFEKREESKRLMKQERNFVKNFMKKGHKKYSNLADYVVGMKQARRVIIALQDELEKSKQRHKKASDNVRMLHIQIDNMKAAIEKNRDSFYIYKCDQETKINKLQNNIKSLEKSNLINGKLHTMAVKNSSENLKDALEYRKERDGAISTLKLLIKEIDK